MGRPIAFASTGEKIDEFETFYPDRLASRILGMGDIETLIEKAEAAFEEEEAEIAAQRLMDGTFTLDDFLQQMQQIKKMGPLGNLIGMMPGMPKEVRDVEIEDSQVNRLEAIIRSMTIEERAKPEIIDGSRRQRIANGSGMKPQDVTSLVKQFGEMQKMMKQLGMTPKKPKRKGSGGKNKRSRGGGRTTPKGGVALGDPAAVLAEEAEKYAGLTLPGLDE